MLLEALQLLEGFDLKTLGPDSPAAAHLTVEALKLAMADRDAYYADPLYEDVPLAGLLAPRTCLSASGSDRPEARLDGASSRRSARGQSLAHR